MQISKCYQEPHLILRRSWMQARKRRTLPNILEHIVHVAFARYKEQKPTRMTLFKQFQSQFYGLCESTQFKWYLQCIGARYQRYEWQQLEWTFLWILMKLLMCAALQKYSVNSKQMMILIDFLDEKEYSAPTSACSLFTKRQTRHRCLILTTVFIIRDDGERVRCLGADTESSALRATQRLR